MSVPKNHIKNGKNLECVICGKKRYYCLSEIELGRGKYCSIICRGLGATGKKSPNWKGGKVMKEGYVLIFKPGHPNSKKYHGVKNGGYVAEHRLVMAEFLKRPLELWEHVHHKNGIKTDNRIKNLSIVVKENHYGKVRCPNCKFNFLIK